MKPELILVGKLGKVYGIKGWLRVHSYMQQPEDIFSYTDWYIGSQQDQAGSRGYNSRHKTDYGEHEKQHQVELSDWRQSGRHWVAKLNCIENPEEAALWTGRTVWIEKSKLPELGPDEYYWRDFEAANVITLTGDNLGRIDHLMETGSNDVFVVKPGSDSVDDRERLIPYLPHVVKEVHLNSPEPNVLVDWDLEF